LVISAGSACVPLPEAVGGPPRRQASVDLALGARALRPDAGPRPNRAVLALAGVEPRGRRRAQQRAYLTPLVWADPRRARWPSRRPLLSREVVTRAERTSAGFPADRGPQAFVLDGLTAAPTRGVRPSMGEGIRCSVVESQRRRADPPCPASRRSARRGSISRGRGRRRRAVGGNGKAGSRARARRRGRGGVPPLRRRHSCVLAMNHRLTCASASIAASR